MERERNLRALRFRGFLLTVFLVVQLAFGICREILYWEDPRTVRTNVDNVICIVTIGKASYFTKLNKTHEMLLFSNQACKFML
ncbi:unnamed protein product [Oikopleura dioica]|uniref:Uncharacterized protein n=1 Tax=Oikopleura dioica TaxID=34765 RepID=E4XGR8_OIKDI|nr:unnamed protein product [Oikopleura dioica]